MTEPRWRERNDEDLRPEPVLYRSEAEINGQIWSLHAVVRMQGSPRRKTLQLPKHDAETIKGILESHYGEQWTLVRDGHR